MKRADLKFKGWDWTELLAIWTETKRIKWPKDTNKNLFAEEEAQGAWLNEQIAALFCVAKKDRTAEQAWQYRQVIRYLKKCASVSPHTSKAIMTAIANDPCDHARLHFIGDIRGWWT